MSLRVLMAAVALTCAPMSAAAAPVEAGPDDPGSHGSHGVSVKAGALVRVEHLMFMPGTVTVGLGDKVTWTFPEVTQHTTTSDQGFWDSGAKAGGATYVRTFSSSGTYRYHCTFHASMRGSVRVPVKVLVPTQATRVLRWALAKASGGISFDVQVRHGKGPWTGFRTDTARPKAKFRPDDRSGTYKVRARTTKGGRSSGWSKPVRIRFA